MAMNYFDKKNIRETFNNRHRTAKSKGIDKLSGVKFLSKLDEEVDLISNKISKNNYKFSPYLENLKSKGRNKKPRIISIPTIRDRIVQSIMKEYLHSNYDKRVHRLPPNLMVKNIYKEFGNYDYCVRGDIKGFYDEIDREHLLSLIHKDDIFYDLIERSIENTTVPKNYSKNKIDKYYRKKGIPQGLAISNILAQIYLTNFDAFFETNTEIYYKRYVDDFIILCKTKSSQDNIHKEIKSQLKQIKLKLNKEKSKKVQINHNNCFDYLGYKLSKSHISVKDSNVEIFIQKIASIFTWYKNGMANPLNRPRNLKNDDRFIEVFINKLNFKIRGATSGNKVYGWLFYYIEINDKTLLYKLDNIINTFFERVNLSKPDNFKGIVRSYFKIKHNEYDGFVLNFDKLISIEDKLKFLVDLGKINFEDKDNYSDDEIDKIYSAERNKLLKSLKKDSGYKYF
ncbi:reverse transcriptase domain-containing protein [Gaetbulibacter saemankumensis]|uniref:reverse transcriptase domain-containing protein n=1 Tax=Gaetbulibacter saemankumensis TaxID=311208 RepID=UPI0004000ACE|nr:reverse transcriptase domain-containing protein [Gaetbulibacter saemankumensis]